MAFEPLSPQELSQFNASQPSSNDGFEPVPIPESGGIEGINVPPEVAVQIALQRQAARESAGTGAFPQQNQLAAAIAQGALSGVSGELAPAAQERFGGIQRYDPASPQFTDPFTYGISEIIGGFAPIGRGGKLAGEAVQGVRRLGPQIARSIGAALPTALTLGAASGAAEPLREGEGAKEVLVEAGKSAGLNAALTALVAGGAPIAANALKKGGNALKNYFSKDPDAYAKASERLFYDAIGEITNPLATQKAGEIIDSGNLRIGLGSVKKLGKNPASLRQAVSDIENSQEELYQQASDFARKNSKYKIKNVFEGVGEELADTRKIEEALDPEGIQALKASVKRLEGDMTLPEALKVQKELNLLSKKVLNKKQLDIKSAEADPDYALIQSIRRKLSASIDDAFTGISGTEDNPYRRYGSVTQLGEFFQDRFDKLRPQKQKGLIGRIREKGIVQGVFPEENEMQIADDAITDLFDITPEFKPVKLTPAEQALRLQRSVKTPQQVEAEAIAAQNAKTAAGAKELKEAERLKRFKERAAKAAATTPSSRD